MCIMIEKLSVGKCSMYIHLSGWCKFYFRALTCLTPTTWRRWCSGRMGRWLWCWCACGFAPAVCLPILDGAILASMAPIRRIFTNQCQVTFFWSLDLATPRKLNSWLLLFLDFGARCIHYFFISLIAVCENSRLAILAIFNARRMSDSSSYTWSPCLAIVADMLKTYKTFVVAFKSKIQLSP